MGLSRGAALLKKTVCIVGLGGVGRELARQLAGFKVGITTVDDHPAGRCRAIGSPASIPLPRLPVALAKADYVVLSLNYTRRFHLIGTAEIAAMKPGVFS